VISFSSIFSVADIRQDPVEGIPITLSPLLKSLPPKADLRKGVKGNVLAPGPVDRQVDISWGAQQHRTDRPYQGKD